MILIISKHKSVQCLLCNVQSFPFRILDNTVIQLSFLLWNWQPKSFAIDFVSVQFEPSNFDQQSRHQIPRTCVPIYNRESGSEKYCTNFIQRKYHYPSLQKQNKKMQYSNIKYRTYMTKVVNHTQVYLILLFAKNTFHLLLN